MKPTVKIKPMMLGDRPRAALAQAGLILDTGMVHFNIPTQKHAFKWHGADYERCLPHLADTLITPSRLGLPEDNLLSIHI